MNRELISKAKFCINEHQRIGNVQSWLLAGPQLRGAAAFNNITAVAQRPLLLQTISASSSAPGGLINTTGLRVSGLSLNCGTQPIPIPCLSPTSGGASASTRVIGIAINQNSNVEVTGVQSGAATFNYAIGALPIDSAMVPTLEQQGDFYNFVVGAGEVAMAAGAAGTLTTTVVRGCWLGEGVCARQDGGANIDSDFVLTDLTVNGLSMLGGDATSQIGLNFLTAAQSSTSDYILDYWVEPNSTISFQFTNLGAAAGTVGAAIFCKPYKAPQTKGNQFLAKSVKRG